MDEGDFAQREEERALERAMLNHMIGKQTPSQTCWECGIGLAGKRIEHGTCIECQEKIERQAGMYFKRQAL